MTDTAGSNAPTMPPGRELDADAFNAEVAEKVMDWKPWKRQTGEWWWQDIDGLRHRRPDFLHDWDAMRLVVNRLVAQGWAVDLHTGDQSGARRNHVSLRRWKSPWAVEASGDTLPHAIALAALKATTSAQQGAEASHVEADRA